MHRPAIEHLRRTDPKLAKIIDEIGDCEMTPRTEGTHFDALVRAIVYQQLSGKAAATIHGRFMELYGGRNPLPEEVLTTSDEQLRSVGLSRQKIASIRDLATRVVSGEVEIDKLDTMSDDEIIASLVRVRGIGRWSAQMFLMFRLGRPNVLPDLDLGVQKGVQHTYRLPALPTPKDVLRIGERWAPFASVASWYMWRMLELPRVIARESAARSAARTARQAEAGPAAAARKTGARTAPAAASRKATATKSVATKRNVPKPAATKSSVTKSSVTKRSVTKRAVKLAVQRTRANVAKTSAGARGTTTPRRVTPKRRG